MFSGVHLFPSNDQVNEHNLSTLQSKGEPVCVCVAVNSDKKAGRASKKLAGGLDNVICLCIGASVMLTKNIWTNAGLVNGAVGTVVDFIKDASDDTKADVVVVDIPRYRGPRLGTRPPHMGACTKNQSNLVHRCDMHAKPVSTCAGVGSHRGLQTL